MVTECGSVYARRKLKINVNKSKAVRCSWVELQCNWGASLNGRNQVFKYLGVAIAANGSELEVLEALRSMWKEV